MALKRSIPMKFFVSLLFLLVSINAFAHCGSCGSGESQDHGHTESSYEDHDAKTCTNKDHKHAENETYEDEQDM